MLLSSQPVLGPQTGHPPEVFLVVGKKQGIVLQHDTRYLKVEVTDHSPFTLKVSLQIPKASSASLVEGQYRDRRQERIQTSQVLLGAYGSVGAVGQFPNTDGGDGQLLVRFGMLAQVEPAAQDVDAVIAIEDSHGSTPTRLPCLRRLE